MYLWNTDVDKKDIQPLEEKNKNITYQTGFKGDSTILKLTPPILENENFVLTAINTTQTKTLCKRNGDTIYAWMVKILTAYHHLCMIQVLILIQILP